MSDSAEIAPVTTHVVILGAGFAGLNCAKRLASNSSLRITLIDKNNYQQFLPLFYQVATGILSPENAAFNLRNVLFHHQNVDVKMSEVVSVDLATRTVKGRNGDTYIEPPPCGLPCTIRSVAGRAKVREHPESKARRSLLLPPSFFR